jgi:two-component sensor histidine kinase
LENARPNGFGEDSHGQVWIGWWRTGVLRYRAGKLKFFGVADGVPAGGIRRILTDRRGRVWIGSSDEGVGVIDDPAADRPTFKKYGPVQGLSAAEIQSLTEDSLGRIYVGHGFGVDRIDPDAPGPLRVRHFTTLDGLTGGEQQTSLRDHQSALWFGSIQGVSRLVPGPDHTPPPPNIYVTGVRVNGRALRIGAGESAALGLGSLHGIRDQLQIDFVSPRFVSGEVLQYQYRLSETGPWSRPDSQRSVQYAELPSGPQRFEVRAINSDGVLSPATAVVRFNVIAPFWRQWWFVLSVVALLGTLAWAGHLFDVRRRLEVEAVRMRIARDLHDQVGTGLSQIAILSEVVQRSPDKEPLAQIADISRELVDSISDIVWAINPARDNLADLAQRMHRFAADLLTARNIAVEFRSDGLHDAASIGPEVRRQLYLIYRECLRNIVRHSNCKTVRVRIVREGDGLTLEVSDDGVGFEPARAARGTGLASLRDRARLLNGHIEWRSGGGTTVTLRIPLLV